MKTLKITQQDIDNNPLLKKIGATAGMEMQYEFVSSKKAKTNEQETNEGDGDDTGGSNPGGKPKPDKP